MDFKQLKSFVTVVEYKSFTRAAQELFISQPTISTHIRSLEEELNTRLIIRSTKSIEITPRGQELYIAAENILKIKNNLIESWNKESQQIIRIAASTLPSSYILPDILPSYSSLHPNTYFIIQQGDSEEVINQVLGDQCTIGLIGMNANHKSLECIPFYEDQMVIITPVNEYYLDEYHAKKNKPDSIDWKKLLHEPIIVRETGSGTQKNANKLFHAMKLSEKDLNITARINDPESIKNLVASGLGISVISKKAAENYRKENRILVFDIPMNATSRNLYVIYKKNYIFHNHVKNFVDYILNYYNR